MNLMALHGVIRTLVRDGGNSEAMWPTTDPLTEPSAFERRAVQALKQHLQRGDGSIRQCTPVAGSAEWWVPSPQETAS